MRGVSHRSPPELGEVPLMEAYERALSGLSPELRAVFILHETEGMSYRDVAEDARLPDRHRDEPPTPRPSQNPRRAARAARGAGPMKDERQQILERLFDGEPKVDDPRGEADDAESARLLTTTESPPRTGPRHDPAAAIPPRRPVAHPSAITKASLRDSPGNFGECLVHGSHDPLRPANRSGSCVVSRHSCAALYRYAVSRMPRISRSPISTPAAGGGALSLGQ